MRDPPMLNALATRIRSAEAGMCGAPSGWSSPVSNEPQPGGAVPDYCVRVNQ